MPQAHQTLHLLAIVLVTFSMPASSRLLRFIGRPASFQSVVNASVLVYVAVAELDLV